MTALTIFLIYLLLQQLNGFATYNRWYTGGKEGSHFRLSDHLSPSFLIGHGYDIHRLSEHSRSKLTIGGVVIPHSKGVEAHSDGDAVYHSIVDAILGALGLPDIGELFPDSDPRWKGADSSIFMKEAHARMQARGYEVGNLDVTVVLQAPKLKVHKRGMRGNIAMLLHAPVERVNVKARTHEEIVSVGEGRAYECHVVVLLHQLPVQAS